MNEMKLLKLLKLSYLLKERELSETMKKRNSFTFSFYRYETLKFSFLGGLA